MPVLTPSLPENKAGIVAVRVLGFAAAIALLYFGRIFLITLIIGIILAFLLDPAVRMFMRMRLPRGLASFVVCSIALLGVYLLGLGLYTEVSALVDDLPAYSQRMNELVDEAATKIDEVEKNTYQLVVPKRYRESPPQDIHRPPRARPSGRPGRRTLLFPPSHRQFRRSASGPNRLRCGPTYITMSARFTTCSS